MSSSRIILAAALAALFIAAPALAAMAHPVPGMPTAEGAGKISATINKHVFRGGVAYSHIVINVTNNDETTSVEKVYILLNASGTPIADPDTVQINSIKVYNDTGGFVGSWSYEVTNVTVNGTNYLAIASYTSPGSLALGNGWTISIDFNATMTSEGGFYTIYAVSYHITSSFETIYHDTAELQVMVDSAAPDYTIRYPGYDGDHYYAKFVTVGDDKFITLNFTLKDTIDGTNYLNLSLYPLNISNVYTNITGESYIYNTTSLSPDKMELYFNVAINVTDNATSLPDGSAIYFSFDVTDYAGNTKTIGLDVVVDNSAPTISVVGFYRDAAFTDELYTNGTAWFSNAGDNTVYLLFKVTDLENLTYKLSDTITVSDGASSYTVERVNSTHFYIEYEIPSTLGDGESVQFTITATDFAGNSATETAKLVADKSAPTLTVTPSLSEGSLNCFNETSLTLTLTATDSVSGFDDAASTIELENYTHYGDSTPSGTSSLAWTETVNLVGEGYYVVTVTVKDNAGNSATHTYLIVLDASEPVVSVTDVNATLYSGKYYTNASGLQFNVSLADYSEMTLEVYVNGSEELSGSYNTSMSPATITLDISGWSEGTYNITVFVKDCNGNSATQMFWLVVDRTAPALDTGASSFDDLNGTIVDPDYDSIGYVLIFTDSSPISSFTVTVDGKDNTSDTTSSGLGTETLTLDLSGMESGLTASGWHTVIVKVTDYAGNTKTINITYYVDVTPPSISTDNFTVEYWTGGVIHLQGNVSDDYGLGPIYLYVYDGSTRLCTITLWMPDSTVTKSLDLSTLGSVNLSEHCSLSPGVTYRVTLNVTDYYYYSKFIPEALAPEAKHTTAANDTEGIRIDAEPPVFSPPDGSDLGWFNALTFNVTVNVTDTGIGLDVDSIAVSTSGASAIVKEEACSGGTCTLTIEVTVAADGDYWLEVSASDLLGNSGSANYTFHVDTTPPTVSFEVSPVMGGAMIYNITVSDAHLAGGEFTLYIATTSGTYAFEVPLAALGGGYWAITTSGYWSLPDWEEAAYTIGEFYADSVSGGMSEPWIIAVDGRLLVFTGLQMEAVNVTFNATASDLAGNTGYHAATVEVPKGAFFPAELYSGWNLMSIPMVNTVSVDELAGWLAIGGGSINAIYIYNYDAGSWIAYIPGVTNASTVPPIKDGMAFWVNYNGSEGFMLMQGMLPYVSDDGGVPPTPIIYDIPEGGYFLGFTSAAPMGLGTYLSSIPDTAIFGMVYLYDSEHHVWVAVPRDSRYTLLPGTGMWIYAYTDTTLIVPTWYSLD